MSLVEKIKEQLTPALLTGAISIVGANMLLNVDLSSNYPLFGYSVPSWAAIGGISTSSFLVAELSHDFVFSNLPNELKGSWMTYESRMLPIALSAVGEYALFKFGVSNDISLVNSLLLGGGSALAGKYASDTFFMK